MVVGIYLILLVGTRIEDTMEASVLMYGFWFLSSTSLAIICTFFGIHLERHRILNDIRKRSLAEEASFSRHK
jgi:hypothetical protein